MLFILALALVAAVAAAVAWFLPRRRREAAVLGAVGALATVACFSATPVGNQNVVVTKLFGKTQDGSYGPGLHFVSPLLTVESYDALRREFPVTGDVLASDNNPLTVDVGFATKLNPALVSVIQEKVGVDYFNSLVVPAGQTAVRAAFSSFPWTKAVSSERGEAQLAIQQTFERIVAEQFRTSGLTEDEARAALVIFPVQIRSVLPDARVRSSVAEKTAAQQDLERQHTLTEIAAQEAQRRKNEGTGVANLFAELPKGFSPDDIAKVLSALATKSRADAMLKAVENNHVTTIVMNGDVGAPVAVAPPAPKTAQ